MSKVFRVIEGLITIARPFAPSGYASFEDDYAPAADQLFDFGGMRKDVYVVASAPIAIKFDNLSNEVININGLAPVQITDQWTTKAYVTFTHSPVTHLVLFANG